MSFRRAALAALGVVALAGCTYPTSAPIIGQRWILPAESTTISVAQFLPSGVSDNGSTFAVTVNPFSNSETLGVLCSACQGHNGATVAKPAFTADFTASASLPAELSSATLVSGSIQVAVHNGFSFDPIRPGAGHTGTITVTLTDGQGGRQLGQLVLDGATDALPSGTTTTETMTLAPGTLGTTIVATVTVDSPEGDPIAINTSEKLTVTATPSSLLVSSARVAVDGRSVDLAQTSFDVANIDQTFIDHIQEGGFTLNVTNPFGVSVTGTLQVTGDGFSPIAKGFTVSADSTSTTSVSFTTDELKRFLGRSNVQISGSGVASASGPITVRAGQEITLDTKLDVSLSFGG
jgi:hypothetical protein